MPAQDITELSAAERQQLRAQTQAQLEDLHTQIEQLHEQARPLARLIDELHTADARDTITGRDPADVFDDPDLLRDVAQREWNRGRGSRVLGDYLDDAFTGLADGIMGFEREVADDYTTVVRLLPKLYLRHRQDTTELAAALRRVYPTLAVDGVMKVDILEHTCGESGSWDLGVTGPDTAVLYRSRHEYKTGDLAEMLDYVAAHHWGHGNTGDDD